MGKIWTASSIGRHRTRDILRWHWSLRDMTELAAIVLAGLALGVLDRACSELERYMERA